MSIFSNGAMHYLIVMYSVFKRNLSLGSLFNTKLIYNEQEEVFAYLFVGISILFCGRRVAIFRRFNKSQIWPVLRQNLA